MHEQPGAATGEVLPMLDAECRIGDAQVGALEFTVTARGGQCFVKLELAQFARPAEWAGEPRHSRTGNGPWPGSSSICPVAKRDRR